MPAFNIACFLIYAWMANGLGFYETIEDVGSSPFHSPEKLMIALLFHLKKKERKKTASGLDHKSCFYLPVCFTIIPRGYLPTGFAFWWLCDD